MPPSDFKAMKRAGLIGRSAQDITGRVFGRLTATRPVRAADGKLQWLCTCECGNTTTLISQRLRSGNTRSCGCLRAENVANYPRRHGLDRTPEHRTWVAMRQRCNNPHYGCYDYYGGRGIRVCPRWMVGEGGKHPFECFLEDMGPKPDPSFTIDRIDPDGDYEPGNCRWASRQEQSTNQRRFQGAA